MNPSKSIDELVALDKKARDEYFDKYARYYPDAPEGQGAKYAIRLSSRTLFSDDTWELKRKFVRALAVIKARKTRQKKQAR